MEITTTGPGCGVESLGLIAQKDPRPVIVVSSDYNTILIKPLSYLIAAITGWGSSYISGF